MCNILKLADRKANRMKNWGLPVLGSTYTDICQVFFISDSLIGVWGHSVNFESFDVKIFKRLLLPQFSSTFNQTL